MKYKLGMAVLTLALTLFGAWVAGFNFNERGFNSLMVFLLCNATSFIGYNIGALIDIEVRWNKL